MTLPQARDRVLAAAARLQQLVPDAVLVGGTAVALHVGHRESLDDDHVVPTPFDLSEIDLRSYRRLGARWHDWGAVQDVCRGVAVRVLDRVAEGQP
jgi:hypothetical protein